VALQTVMSTVMLAGFIWVVLYLLPKARREDDTFAVACALLSALVALIGWLLLATSTR
jgi:hypothetical protein